MARKINKWTDPNTGIEVWSNSDSTQFWLKKPGARKAYSHSNKEALYAQYDSLTKTKPKAPTALEKSTERVLSGKYDSDIQGRSDSLTVFKKGGGEQYEPAGEKKKRVGKEITKLVEEVKTLKALEASADEVEAPSIQAVLEQKQQELEAGYKVLGIDYQRPSGDADEGGGGFWKGVGDFLTPEPNPERDFKVKMHRELNKQLASREIEIPGTWKHNQNKWITKKVDEAWQAKQAEIPLEEQSIDELIKGAEGGK